MRGVAFSYAPGAPVLEDIDVDVARGDMVALVGPNGAGKSTLLRLMLGARVPDRGEVRYNGRPLSSWQRKELAAEIGVVPQLESLTFPVTVRELVAMGRYPHLGLWTPERARDRVATEQALQRCDLGELIDRPVSTLSGGERQRARIARALAQEPATLVLDEPTAALDVRHEMAIFELLSRICRDSGATVLMVTHNLNLAARYADRLVLLHRGRIIAAGAPADVMQQSVLESVYQWPLTVTPHPGPGPDRGIPQVTALRPSWD